MLLLLISRKHRLVTIVHKTVLPVHKTSLLVAHKMVVLGGELHLLLLAKCFGLNGAFRFCSTVLEPNLDLEQKNILSEHYDGFLRC